jgi:putative PIN family toxin of toxin-antitoxin system
MRILLDTNILARATPGPPSLSRDLLRLASLPPHVLILSPFLLSELSRVLGYDRMRRVHGLDDPAIQKHLLDLQATALLVDPPAASGLSVPHDPDDDPVIAAAVAGQAEVLCTLDRHLWHPDVQAFCGQHGIRVLTDVELLDALRAFNPQQP